MRRRRKLYGKLPSGDWIRILVIEPGRAQDRIFCRLQLCNIHHVPLEYEALSYVWGTSEERVEIICNGHAIGITRHLREALERVRLTDRPRLLWADAICINQKNIEERGHQVRLMSQIYKKASKVLIWAGQDENRHASSAFSLIRRIANGGMSHTDALCSANFDLYGCQTPTPSDPGNDSLSTTCSGWESLRAFYKVPWLRRLWVLQEVVLSSSAVVMWGDEEISWELVGLASERIQDDDKLWNAVDQRTGIGNAYLMHSLRNPKHAVYSFRVLLQRSRRFEATEPKDRIFAVLGLPTADTAPDKGLLFLEPDYSLSVSQLYLNIARRMLERERDLGLLSAVQHGPSIEKGLPTWVPRWDRFSINPLAGVDGKSHAVATGLPEHDVGFASRKPGTLMTQGLELDAITKMTDAMSEEIFQNAGPPVRIGITWIRRVQGIFGEHIENHLKALCWTMTAGKDWADEPVHDTASHWSDFVAWWVQISSQTLDPGIRAAARVGSAQRFLTAASDCWGRRLFVTCRGYLGLGPEALREHDLICVLAGGPVPYVLRKVDDYFYFIGESYVYGMMGDEAVQQWREGKLVLKNFELH
jgi:hypothetical protein